MGGNGGYLKVPTPPAAVVLGLVCGMIWGEKGDVPSRRSVTPLASSWLIHRIAKARRMCPCATTRTSPDTPSPLGFPVTSLWYLDRISSISVSNRSVTSFGDLVSSWTPKSVILSCSLPFVLRQQLIEHTPRQDIHLSRYPTRLRRFASSAPESARSSSLRSHHNPIHGCRP